MSMSRDELVAFVKATVSCFLTHVIGKYLDYETSNLCHQTFCNLICNSSDKFDLELVYVRFFEVGNGQLNFLVVILLNTS